MEWWIWVVAGLVLCAGEMMVPGGFVLLFFGVSAIVVGALVAIGLPLESWLQWTVFAALSLLSLLLFRAKVVAMLGGGENSRDLDGMVGEIAIAATDIEPGGSGRAEFRGSTWSAHNDGVSAIRKGARCKVARVDGLVLHLSE